jgi:hypothetical protein
VFEIVAMVVNVIALVLEMPCALALATLVFQLWTIFAAVEVSTEKARRCRILLRRGLGYLALFKWWVLAALSTFLRWLLYGVQTKVFIGENSTVSLCGDEVHAVGNNVVETHLVPIFVKLLQDSSAQIRRPAI